MNQSQSEITIVEGISHDHIDQLIHHATNDLDVRKFTSDGERFASREKVIDWKSKASAIYTVTDASQDLLGLLWFQKMSIPHADFIIKFDESLYNDTFAIRLYAHARGKRLAGWFMEHAFARYEAKHIWLKASHDNHAAVRSYSNFGFQAVSTPDNDGKIIMILP